MNRPPARNPAQVNLQMPHDMRDDLDAVARVAGVSRAEIIRDCIAEALDAVSMRRYVRQRVRIATASAIRAEREGRP